MSPDQAQLVYNVQRDAENERERVESETIEALSGTSIPQQSSHNSLCIGVSSWLLVGSKPADNHNETPMHRELCDDCWGIDVPDRQPAQLERQPAASEARPRLAGRATTAAPTICSTSARPLRATSPLLRCFWGRIWFCSCCFCLLDSDFRYDCQ
jgi:hypothetical protein